VETRKRAGEQWRRPKLFKVEKHVRLRDEVAVRLADDLSPAW